MGFRKLVAWVLFAALPSSAVACTWGLYDGSLGPPPPDGGFGSDGSTLSNCVTSGPGGHPMGDGFDLDSRGGSVSCDNGAFTILAPAPAVGQIVHVRVGTGELNAAHGQGAVGQVYDVSADGMFVGSVSVAFANASVGAGPGDSLHIASSPGQGSPWTLLPYEVVRDTQQPQTVTGFTQQMSRFSLFITGGQGLDPAAACGTCNNSSCASTCCQKQGGNLGGSNPCGCTVPQGQSGSQYAYEDCYDTTCGGRDTNACPACFRTCCQMANARLTGSGSSGSGGNGSPSCACIDPSGNAEGCFAQCLQMTGNTNACNGGDAGGITDAGGPPPPPPLLPCEQANCDTRTKFCCLTKPSDGGVPSGACFPISAAQLCTQPSQKQIYCEQSAQCTGGQFCCASLGTGSAICQTTCNGVALCTPETVTNDCPNNMQCFDTMCIGGNIGTCGAQHQELCP